MIFKLFHPVVWFTLNFPSLQATLNPTERARTAYLNVTKYLRLRCSHSRPTCALLAILLLFKPCVFNNQLLNFSIIRDISVIINSSCRITSTSHLPTPTSNCDQFKVVPIYFLHIHITLNQWCTPVGANLLSNNISEYIFIPHVAAISTESIWTRIRHTL
jgi:hypothetical protein